MDSDAIVKVSDVLYFKAVKLQERADALRVKAQKMRLMAVDVGLMTATAQQRVVNRWIGEANDDAVTVASTASVVSLLRDLIAGLGIVASGAGEIDNSAGYIQANGGDNDASTGQTGVSVPGAGGIVILIYNSLVVGTEEALMGAFADTGWNGWTDSGTLHPGKVIKIPCIG